MGTVGGSYSYNAICDVCGFQYKASELKKRWDGLMVCEADYETRHPLDFYRVKNDHHQLPFTRTEVVENTGYYPSDPEDWVIDANDHAIAMGNRFLVGSANRRLLGLHFVRGTISDQYPRAPMIFKLWDNSGVLLQTWKTSELRYSRGYDIYAEAFATLTPAYVLTAGEYYTISTYTTEYIGTSLWTPTAQPYLTLDTGYSDAADVFPNAAYSASFLFDVITGSDN